MNRYGSIFSGFLKDGGRSFNVVLIWLLSFSIHTALLEAESIRLGWQIPWATQGQLVMNLRHTNIPERVGIELDYAGFSYGGPLNLAALSGDVDVLLTADQPALVLLSKSSEFVIVARMMYNRVCVYVPPASPIHDLQSLGGKRLLGPVGAAAERVALAALRRDGVDLDTMHLGKLDMTQQNALITRAGSEVERWPGADAFYGFDPLPAIFETQGKARAIHCGKVVSLVVASRNMLEERRPELEAFLRAFALSWYELSQTARRANRLFAEHARLDAGDEVLDRCASIEPNRWVQSIDELRLDFIEQDLATLQEALEFLLERGIVQQTFDPLTRIELGPLEKALEGDLEALYSEVRPRQHP